MSRKTLAAITDVIAPAFELRTDPTLFPGARPTGGKVPTVPSLAEIESAAYQRGQSDGYESARTAIEAAAETHSQEMQAALEAERARVLEGEAAALASKLISAISSIETRLVAQITPVLRHVLAAAVVDRALAELGQILCRAIVNDGAFQVTVTASQTMIDALKRRLPADWNRATFVAADVADIRVVADDADISVDFETWRRAIEGAVL